MKTQGTHDSSFMELQVSQICGRNISTSFFCFKMAECYHIEDVMSSFLQIRGRKMDVFLLASVWFS